MKQMRVDCGKRLSSSSVNDSGRSTRPCMSSVCFAGSIAGVPGGRLHSLAWRSSYRVNVRMVDQLRVGRVFLAGDAAHVDGRRAGRRQASCAIMS